jgi:class 3 adenylate cyclase
VLEEYHRCLGEVIVRYGGTLERFVGDGLLVVFNDPVPCPDHPGRAVRMALEMRRCMEEIGGTWRRRGHELGFGVGIARGYATLGRIGFDERTDYAVIGSVPNLASRLCDEARAGQILVSPKVMNSVEDEFEARSVGELPLKGFHRPIACFEIIEQRVCASGDPLRANP